MTEKTKQHEQDSGSFSSTTETAGGAQTQAEESAERREQSETEELRARLEQTTRELAELKDKYLRVLAENENARKRMRQQAEENIRMEREKLLRDLLPVVDNLERTVEAARGGGNGKPIVEGAELVLRSMKDFLRSHGVMQISAKGERFDPALHEALDHVESGAHAPDTVVSELHAGYMIGDRVLRPARVTVAKAPPAQGNAAGRERASGVTGDVHPGREQQSRDDEEPS
jgi:molecular chaperone GrpE